MRMISRILILGIILLYLVNFSMPFLILNISEKFLINKLNVNLVYKEKGTLCIISCMIFRKM